MPYADAKKQREAKAKWARENYVRQKAETKNIKEENEVLKVALFLATRMK